MYNRGVGEGKIPVLAALSGAALQAALDADVCNCNPSSSRSTGLATFPGRGMIGSTLATLSTVLIP